jgi:protein-S-isoprenylcysteine O-methyltransferase Ste14
LIQFSAAAIYFIIWILDSFIFEFSTVFKSFIPFILRLILFLSLFIIGCVLIFGTGHILFHKKNKSSELITTGIFAHTRHPLYLGVLLIYLGLILFSFSLISIIVWIIIIILYDKLATFEENDLKTLYKEVYTEYQKKVPKWIPKIKS